MIDFSTVKAITAPEGAVKKISCNGIVLWESAYTNMVLSSTESGGATIYNGGLGYKNGYRVRSGGAEGTDASGSCTGFIPVKGGDVVRFSGWDFSAAKNSNAINVSDSTFTNIGQSAGLGSYGILAAGAAYSAYNRDSLVKESENVWKWIVPPAASGVAYIRVSGYTSADGSKMIVTINEEI